MELSAAKDYLQATRKQFYSIKKSDTRNINTFKSSILNWTTKSKAAGVSIVRILYLVVFWNEYIRTYISNTLYLNKYWGRDSFKMYIINSVNKDISRA